MSDMRLSVLAVLFLVCIHVTSSTSQSEAGMIKRGFRSASGLASARGFGKREYEKLRRKLLNFPKIRRGFKFSGLATSRGFGKRSDADTAIMNAESGVPANWLAMQIIQSPELAVSLLEKLLDVNRDGVLTAEELASIQQ